MAKESVQMFMHLWRTCCVTWLEEVELPVDDPAVNNLEDDNPLSTVFEEVGHLLLQLGLHFMLGYHLQVVP